MNSEDLLNLKAKTETAVRELLVGFAAETGLVVLSVNFSMERVRRYGKEPDTAIECSAVELDVRL